jgi:hypothetical protein
LSRLNREISEIIAVSALVILHFLFLLSFFRPALTTPDANSYYVMARLFATDGSTAYRTESPLQYLGPHWKCIRDNAYYCSHAPGLSVLCSPLFRAGGPGAALLLTPLLASLSLALLYLIVRMWLGPPWALPAALLMALNPMANEHALFGDSHIAVCFFMLLGIYLLFRWRERPDFYLAFAAGVAWGIIPTVRYAEALLPAAAFVYLALHLRIEKKAAASLAFFSAGLAVPLVPLLVRDLRVYGAVWKTGYAVTGEQHAFGLMSFLYNFPSYMQKLMSEGCAFLFPLGFIGIVLLCIFGRTRKEGILFLLLTLPTTLLYIAYYWPPDPQSMRFLLPTFHVYTIAGLWLLRELTKDDRKAYLGAVISLVAFTAAWGAPLSLSAMERLKEQGEVALSAMSLLELNAEPGSVLITCDGISQLADYWGRWRLADGKVAESVISGGQSGKGSSLPFYSLEYLVRNREGRKRYGGKSGKELLELFRKDVRDWAGDNRKVYLLLKGERCSAFEKLLPQGDGLERIDEISVAISSPARPGGFPGRPPFPPGGPGGPAGPGSPGSSAGPGGPGGPGSPGSSAGPQSGSDQRSPPMIPGGPHGPAFLPPPPGSSADFSMWLFDLRLDDEPLVLARWKIK